MPVRVVLPAGLVILLLGAAVSVSPVEPGRSKSTQPGIRRDELQRHDLSTPGREVVQVRISFDPGTRFGSHRHPGEEVINVLGGALEYQVDGQPPRTLRAGDVLFIPAGTIHAARNVGTDVGVELATYIVIKGKPILEMLERERSAP